MKTGEMILTETQIQNTCTINLSENSILWHITME